MISNFFKNWHSGTKGFPLEKKIVFPQEFILFQVESKFTFSQLSFEVDNIMPDQLILSRLGKNELI